MNSKKNEGRGRELLQQAREAALNAYAPYSSFYVGAALLTDDGEVFTGANVENASYGLSVCAERAAVFAAAAAGKRRFSALALYSPSAEGRLYPCGACLQVLAEFADEMEIYAEDENGEPGCCLLSELLPRRFEKPR